MENARSPVEWRDVLLPTSASMREAIEVLDRTGLQIILVVAPDERLLGTVTDGDIRRALLCNATMQTSIETIMATKPMVAPVELDHITARQIMKSNRIIQLPVVDAEQRVVGLHLWDQLEQPLRRENLMVIMAGGRGERLRPFTEDCPKPMLAVAGKPILEHIIERAQLQGFSNFVLAVHYLGQQIEDYFGDGEKWNIHIDYLRESTPLGTAGAISLLTARPSLPVVVTNGDVLTDIHYGELLDFHQRHKAGATMAVRQHEWQHPFGVVHTEGVDIVSMEEKPVHRTHVNTGIYVLAPEVLGLLEPNEPCDMPMLFHRVQMANQRTIAYPMHEPWLDVGRPDDLPRAALLKTKVPATA
jgi:dTDP-glucose pyrophosphorylase